MLLQVKRHPILVISGIIIIIIALVSGYIQFTSAQKPMPRGIQCGTLYLHGGNSRPAYDGNGKHDTVLSTGNCFWNAYQQCHTATLTLTQTGTDTGTTSMFIVDQQQGKCVLTDTVQSYSANFGGSKSSFTTYTCTGLTRNGNDLRFAHCGNDGDILVSL